MSFSTLGLSEILYKPLASHGYEQPTPVQLQSIPIVLSGRDLLARAQTGTGKTAAFGLPMIDLLVVRREVSPKPQTKAAEVAPKLQTKASEGPRSKAPRGLVLVPTRELAIQVHRALATYGAPAKLRVAAIYGGVGIGPQRQAIRQGADIIVATPGRLIDHLQQKAIDLSAIEILTLDEADRMLDMGFLPQLRRVLASLPRARQTLLFSATITSDVKRLAADFTREPLNVDVSPRETVATTVSHRVHVVSEDAKSSMLSRLLKETPATQALVFCKTKRRSNRVGEHLNSSGIRAAVIHGNKSQSARNRALGDFKAGRVNVLVATDIAARGLDIAHLPLVVNYDLPLVAHDYVHRVGRTGRAGREGRAVSLVTASDRGLLREIQRLLPAPIEETGVSRGRAAETGGRR
jgi:ATP-dependent RNA helicase RhlE